MYKVKTTITTESGEQITQVFDSWEDATQWVFERAWEDDMPSVVTMTKETD